MLNDALSVSSAVDVIEDGCEVETMVDKREATKYAIRIHFFSQQMQFVSARGWFGFLCAAIFVYFTSSTPSLIFHYLAAFPHSLY